MNILIFVPILLDLDTNILIDSPLLLCCSCQFLHGKWRRLWPLQGWHRQHPAHATVSVVSEIQVLVPLPVFGLQVLLRVLVSLQFSPSKHMVYWIFPIHNREFLRVILASYYLSALALPTLFACTSVYFYLRDTSGKLKRPGLVYFYPYLFLYFCL